MTWRTCLRQHHSSRRHGPAGAALFAAGAILLLIVLGALLASCAKVETIEEAANFSYEGSDNEAEPSPTEPPIENGTVNIQAENGIVAQ